MCKSSDILHTLTLLRPLSSYPKVLVLGVTTYIQSVPQELSDDINTILTVAQVTGFVSSKDLMLSKGWTLDRAVEGIEGLVRLGIVWVDEFANPRQYWVLGFFLGSIIL